MICPNCGNVSNGKRFCTKCGTELDVYLAPTAPDFARTAPAPDNRPTAAVVSPSSASGALTGKTLDQKYYIESKLGAGGMGTVYRARRLLIGDMVAVNVLNPDHAADPQAVECFHRVAQTAARLKHPNVLNVYDFGVSREGLNYLVTELAEGESLRSLLDRQGALAETDAVEIIRQVCLALDEAHKQSVSHLDIKPENILVRTIPSGFQVKVLDFNVAALRDFTSGRLTPTGIAGTPQYMSPEHCLGEELDGRSDIYSVGVVLFETLTGVLPFDSPTPTAIVVKQVNQPPPAPRTMNPNISPAVEAVTLHALEKRRGARPQTAGEMARELMAAVLKPGQVSPRPRAITKPIFGEMYAKTGSSGKHTLLIFGALLLLACVGVALWWYLQKGGNEKTIDSDGSNQQTANVSGQTANPDRNATVKASTSPAPVESPPADNKLWALISDQTINVADAASALGAADRHMAVIKPGGQLALDYREGKFFGDGHGADLSVHGPEQERVSYIIFVRNDPVEDWQRIDINHKGFPQKVAGHDMGHHGVRQARQVLIRNTGDADLAIDAVSVVYKDRAHVGSAAGHRH